MAFSMPRADFGIAQAVPSSLKVANRASGLRETFDMLDNFSLTIKSGYPLLILIRDMFASIATKLSAKGMALMDAIVALANDDSGPVTTAFNQANQAIATLDALLKVGLSTELDTLKAKLGSRITDQLVDGFQSINRALQALAIALSALQEALIRAQQAAGAGPVTEALVRKHVPSSLVYNVLIALNGFGSYLPSSVGAIPDKGVFSAFLVKAQVTDRFTAAASAINVLGNNTFTITSNYTLLSNMSTTVGSIANRSTVALLNFTTTMLTSSGNSYESMQQALTKAGQILTSIKTLISTGFTNDYKVLEDRNKTYVSDMFKDSFNRLSLVLSSFQLSFSRIVNNLDAVIQGTLQVDPAADLSVRLAQVASLRRVYEVRQASAYLRGAAISPLNYTVKSTLENIVRGDDFTVTAESKSQAAILLTQQAVEQFDSDLNQMKSDAMDTIEYTGTMYEGESYTFLIPSLEAISTYNTYLKGPLAQLNDTFSVASIAQKMNLLNDTITNFTAQSDTFDDDLYTFYGVHVSRAIHSVVQVLVASGPYGRYCYHKHYPLVLRLAMDNYEDISLCYQREMDRLYHTEGLISEVIELVFYNLEQLLNTLTLCVDTIPCPSACDACVQTIGKYYNTMAKLTDEKFNLLLQFIPYETSASLQRLKSCVAFTKYKLLAEVHDIVVDVSRPNKAKDQGVIKEFVKLHANVLLAPESGHGTARESERERYLRSRGHVCAIISQSATTGTVHCHDNPHPAYSSSSSSDGVDDLRTLCELSSRE
ncbi:hypothetical protein AND_009523 [Anopheles darlingi]|uniref:Uncharacterized protein n=1 Tax=Anopheles darlingi TaxID=43151 RepID=W5J7L0_ANODA|nr:hypothetical protein AND_009523 [Anopheles darlingi]